MRRSIIALFMSVVFIFGAAPNGKAQTDTLDGEWWDCTPPYCAICSPMAVFLADWTPVAPFACWELDYTLPTPVYIPPSVPIDAARNARRTQREVTW